MVWDQTVTDATNQTQCEISLIVFTPPPTCPAYASKEQAELVDDRAKIEKEQVSVVFKVLKIMVSNVMLVPFLLLFVIDF